MAGVASSFVSLAIRQARTGGCGRTRAAQASARGVARLSGASGVGSWHRLGSARSCGQSRVSFGGEECKDSVLSPSSHAVSQFLSPSTLQSLCLHFPLLTLLLSLQIFLSIHSLPFPFPFLSPLPNSPLVLLGWMVEVDSCGALRWRGWAGDGELWDLEMERQILEIWCWLCPADSSGSSQTSPWGLPFLFTSLSTPPSYLSIPFYPAT